MKDETVKRILDQVEGALRSLGNVTCCVEHGEGERKSTRIEVQLGSCDAPESGDDGPRTIVVDLR